MDKKMKLIESDQAPSVIGTYSLGVKVQNMLYLSGQIGISPQTMELVSDRFDQQASQLFENIQLVLQAEGCDLTHVVRLTIYLTDMNYFAQLNQTMQHYFRQPYPARSVVAVSALPKGAKIEADTIAYDPR